MEEAAYKKTIELEIEHILRAYQKVLSIEYEPARIQVGVIKMSISGNKDCARFAIKAYRAALTEIRKK